MTLRAGGALLTLAVGAALAGPAAAQSKPTVAIIPTQFFSADADSAKAITQGLREQYERQGYTVIADDKAQSTFDSMQLKLDVHYPDRTALKFGKSAGADLVVYPRLLALGIPAANAKPKAEGLFAPGAVILLRVNNVHTGGNIYCRQISREFVADEPPSVEAFKLPQPVASATAQEVTGLYFDRVAGSRQEIRTTPVKAPARRGGRRR